MNFAQNFNTESVLNNYPRRALEITPNAPAPSKSAFTFDGLCSLGRLMNLAPQQRAVFSKREQVAILREGMLAVDAAPIKEKLQVLDFLVAGDVVTAPIIQRAPGVSIRAITPARVILLDDSAIECEPRPEQYWASLFGRCQRQLARTNAHQLIVGHLETDARVASFILALALSRSPTQTPGLTVEL